MPPPSMARMRNMKPPPVRLRRIICPLSSSALNGKSTCPLRVGQVVWLRSRTIGVRNHGGEIDRAGSTCVADSPRLTRLSIQPLLGRFAMCDQKFNKFRAQVELLGYQEIRRVGPIDRSWQKRSQVSSFQQLLELLELLIVRLSRVAASQKCPMGWAN